MIKIEIILQRIAIASLILCASAVLYVAHCLVAPYSVMDIKSLRVLNPEVEAGELIEYELAYCKDPSFGSLRAQIHLSLKDGIIHNLPSESGVLPSGCRTVILALEAPAVPEGIYRLEMMLVYRVNPVRHIEVHAVSGVFKISSKRRLKDMLKRQLPDVIHEPEIQKEIQNIP